MNLEKRINAFVKLGLFLKQFKNELKNTDVDDLNAQFYDDFEELILRQKSLNGWFVKENIILSVDEIANSLKKENLLNWMDDYDIPSELDRTVGVIMAGNIPMVGFHDFLSVLIVGHSIKAKLSSEDNTLLRFIGKVLISIEPEFESKINFVEKLENFDAVIATGSNNSARYFEQYFSKYPNIIRKHRNSIGIVNVNDGIKELELLGQDVFQYYGLGCRSVSKIYIPEGYRLDTIFEAFYAYKHVTDNNKYANNYDYNKAVYLLGNNALLDNNFLLLKEDTSLSAPVGVLHYEYYNNINTLKIHLKEQGNAIQCIVSSSNTTINTVEFGRAQCPKLDDYADDEDTIGFLLNLG